MKRVVSMLLAASLMLGLTACSGGASGTQAAENQTGQGSAGQTQAAGNGGGDADGYPEEDIYGWITYGAGGGTDSASRALAAGMTDSLGRSIIMDNMTGASGAIAAQYVLGQDADGYNLLFGSEGVHSFQFMDVADIGIDDFKTVFLSCFTAGVLVVPAGSAYQTYEAFIEAAKASPGTIRMGTTGVAGIPSVIATMMKHVHGVEFNMVSYDSDSDAMTALLGGHIDAFISYHPTAVSYEEAGDVKSLMVFHDETISSLPDVPCVTETYPAYKAWLPYGPYFGLWVSKDTPDDVVEVLANAAKKSYEGTNFQEYLTAGGAIGLAYTGEEAVSFMTKMQSSMAYLLFDSGAITTDPAEFGIVRNE